MTNELIYWRRLEETIRGLYHTFSRYKLDGPVLCEMTDRIVVPYGVPLRKRAANDFSRYEWKAITTLGSVEAYKHFLPRLLELSTELERRRAMFSDELPLTEPYAGIGIDMIAMKLVYAKAADLWSASELDSLATFGSARLHWELSLSEASGLRHTLEFLEAVGRPAGPILSRMVAADDSDAMASLCRVMIERLDRLLTLSQKYKLTSDSRHDAFDRWLFEPTLLGRVNDTFFRLSSTSAAAPLSEVVSKLEWLRAATGVTNT